MSISSYYYAEAAGRTEYQIFTISNDRISREAKTISSVRLSVRQSVRLFSLYILNQVASEVEFVCVCVYHGHSSPEVEGQGHKSDQRSMSSACERGNAVMRSV